nr:tripartite tricarboxylate transporter substrate binding protein [Pseudomonas sp.]
MKRRIVLSLAISALLAPLAAPQAADSYPTRSVRVITPYGAGGSNDTSIRII